MLQQTDLQSSNQLPGRSPSSSWRRPASRSTCCRWTGRPSCRGAPAGRRRRRAAGTSSSRPTSRSTLDNPGTNAFAAGACEKAWFGWPCDPEIEVLRAAFIRESDPIKQKEIGDRDLRPPGRPGRLYRARPVQGLRRLPQGPPLGLAGRPGAGVVEHHQEGLTLPPLGRERPFPAGAGLTPPGRAALPASARRLRRRACRATPWCGSRWRRCPRCPGRHWPAPSRRPTRPGD